MGCGSNMLKSAIKEFYYRVCEVKEGFTMLVMNPGELTSMLKEDEFCAATNT